MTTQITNTTNIQKSRLPSAWLLLLQLFIIMTIPLLNDSLASQAISWCFSAIALVLVAIIIKQSPIFNMIGFILVGCALILSSGVAWFGLDHLVVWANVIEGIAYFYGAIGIVMYILKDSDVTKDELFAAAAGFTLLAWGFAFLYSACQIVFPQSIIAAINSNAPRTWIELLFMSFTSLTNTGLGDVIPVKPLARAISSVQMFCGVMYMVLIVSRLVGMASNKKPHVF